MLRRTYELDMVPGGIPLSIHLSQYDSDVQLIFQLYASQGALAIPDTGVTAQIRGTNACCRKALCKVKVCHRLQ